MKNTDKSNLTPRCPKCGDIDEQVFAGYNRSGTHRCVCHKCNYKYTLDRIYGEEIKEEGIRLLKSGLSGREVGRILGINKRTAYNWLRASENNSGKDKKGGFDGDGARD